MDPRNIVQRLRGGCSFDELTLVMLGCAVFAVAALAPMQADSWWHLRAGSDIASAGRVALIDTYSHTAYGAPWPDHEWLAQLVLYAAYATGGLPLVNVVTTALVLAAWLLVWRVCGGSGVSRAAALAMLLIPASLHWTPRPHVFSLFFLALTTALVVEKRVAWLPLVFVLWGNCHGGVLLGIVVLAAALASDARLKPRATALVFVACCVAVTVNPLGLSFWTEMLRSLARIRQYPIDEWRRPGFTELALAPFWIAAAAVCATVALRWRTLLREDQRAVRIYTASAVAVLPLALTAVRNVGPFVMLGAPVLCSWLPSSRDRSADDHPRGNLAAAFASAAVAVVAVAAAYAKPIPLLRWEPLPPASLLVLRQCPDNIYNRYDEGGYLLWFARDRRVFLDGRQDPYPPALIQSQLRIERSGDYEPTFGRYGIRCAYLPSASPVSARLAQAGWSTLYRDADWTVLAQ